MKSLFFLLLLGYNCCHAFIFLSPRLPKLSDSNFIKKVEFEESSGDINHLKVGSCHGRSCKVHIKIEDEDLDDDEYCMVDNNEDDELVIVCGGDDEDEDGQPCSQ